MLHERNAPAVRNQLEARRRRWPIGQTRPIVERRPGVAEEVLSVRAGAVHVDGHEGEVVARVHASSVRSRANTSTGAPTVTVAARLCVEVLALATGRRDAAQPETSAAAARHDQPRMRRTRSEVIAIPQAE